MDFYIVLTMFHFICLVQHSNIPSKQKNIIPDNNGEKNVSSDLAISAQKSLKLSHKKKRNFNQSKHYFSKLRCFLKRFDVVFHMFMGIKKTFNQNKNCSLDKTGEGNVVSDLAISPQKYPKIGTQEEQKMSRNLQHCFS